MLNYFNRLIRYDYLTKETAKDPNAIEEAKKKYQELMEESVDLKSKILID